MKERYTGIRCAGTGAYFPHSAAGVEIRECHVMCPDRACDSGAV